MDPREPADLSTDDARRALRSELRAMRWSRDQWRATAERRLQKIEEYGARIEVMRIGEMNKSKERGVKR